MIHRNWLRRLTLASAAALTLSGALATGAALAPPAGASELVTKPFYSTGTEQSFEVPPGITELFVRAYGGPGGAGLSDEEHKPGAPGGSGAEVSATLAGITPGETFYIEVGGAGFPAQEGKKVQGGLNGGAPSGESAGGGGGASDLRTCSAEATSCPGGKTSLQTRFIVAAGGGGGGAVAGTFGGGAGGSGTGYFNARGTGLPGEPGEGATAGAGGEGGTPFAGGPGGTGGGLTPSSGHEGTLAVGGSGATGSDGGGGGGGGLYGGGGGGAGEASGGGGGGAGSSIGPEGSTIVPSPIPVPMVTISYVLSLPEASTGWPGMVTPTTAIVGGLVMPEGQATRYWFEYGTTNSYGQTTLVEGLAAVEAPQLVETAIAGLTPATTYHYRLVAENAQGRKEGADETFTTSSEVTGPAGPAGPQGPAGLTGAQGTPGQVELVTCTTTTTKRGHGKHARKVRRTSCTTRLTSSPIKFTVQGKVTAALARHGHIYARGSLSTGRLVLHSHHRIGRGRYTLILTGGGHTGRQQITLE